VSHIADANKMVSDTPRTDGLLTAILDAFGYVHQGNCPQRWVNHSRELERELNAANDRIKRLEEAGDHLERDLKEIWEETRSIQKKVAELYKGAEEQQQRIQSLIEERDRANRLAEWKWNLRDEFQLLLGTDKIEEGIEVVKELKRHINRLEEAGDYIAEENDIYIRRQEWRKAKEAKP